MKKFIKAIVLKMMAFAVMCSPALAAEPQNFNCKVTAVADREFTFLYPADTIIAYKDTSAEIGYIGIKNLLLYPDEALIITVTTEPMVHVGDVKTKLPYTVKCKGLPSKITSDGMWPVIVKIGSWGKFKVGDYIGKVNFIVNSSLTGETLLTKTTYIKASVPSHSFIEGSKKLYGFINLNVTKTGEANKKPLYITTLTVSLAMIGFFVLMKNCKIK